MTGKTHQLIGLACGLTAATILNKTNVLNPMGAIAFIAGCSVGSLIPDVDHTGSIAGKKVFFLSYPIKGLFMLFRFLHKKTRWKIFSKLSEMFTHRGICHAPLLWILLFTPLYLLIYNYLGSVQLVQTIAYALVSGLFIGTIMHIFADMFNPTGVPILMPIINRKFRVAHLTTGSKGEVGLRVCLVLLNVLLILGSLVLLFS